ncbi:hypothetical protein ACS0TY_025168 [Phlomoides rotata]
MSCKGFQILDRLNSAVAYDSIPSASAVPNSGDFVKKKRDNSVECFRRACKFFNMEVKPLRVWDFSGQTTLLLLNDRNRTLKEPQKQTEQDLLLELQVYGLTDEMCCGKISIMQIQHLKTMILHINKKKVLSRDTLSIKFDTEKRYTQMAKYVFPNRRFESRSFEEALLSDSMLMEKYTVLVVNICIYLFFCLWKTKVLDIETMETQVLKRNDQYEIIEVEFPVLIDPTLEDATSPPNTLLSAPVIDTLQGHEERVIIISSKDRGNAFSNTENALPQIDSLILKPNPLHVLAILAKDVGELAIKENIFSPILKR